MRHEGEGGGERAGGAEEEEQEQERRLQTLNVMLMFAATQALMERMAECTYVPSPTFTKTAKTRMISTPPPLSCCSILSHIILLLSASFSPCSSLPAHSFIPSLPFPSFYSRPSQHLSITMSGLDKLARPDPCASFSSHLRELLDPPHEQRQGMATDPSQRHAACRDYRRRVVRATCAEERSPAQGRR
eukprot:768749-Hanusia_phi.AAC.21